MPQYRIMTPCRYVGEDGIPHHRKQGEIVKLTPDAARILGARVQLVAANPARPQPKPKVKGH